mgnify:FL=1
MNCDESIWNATKKGIAMIDHAIEDGVNQEIAWKLYQSYSVELRRPRWMPMRLYLYLMRTIIVKTTPLRVERT